MLAVALAPVGAPVGLLWVVFDQRYSRVYKKAKDYLRQAAASAHSARALNPGLPRALATNVPSARMTLNGTFDLFIPPEALRCPQPCRARHPLWVPRLLALAASPFELTLEVDSSVTFCSAQLHAALLREHRRDRFDLAVNFEATALAPPKAGFKSRFGEAPRRVVDILPHNFALLVRHGPGWRALLELWLHVMERYVDDQMALRVALQRLTRDQFAVPPARAGCNASIGGGDAARCGGVTHVRVWRLAEAMLGFKSADKLMPGWKMVSPRYSRPIDGVVHLVHSFDRAGLGGHRSVCDALNEREGMRRLLVQAHTPYRSLTSRAECLAALLLLPAPQGGHRRVNSTVSPRRVAERYGRPLCGMLPDVPRRASAEPSLAEPLPSFWRWLKSVNLTSTGQAHTVAAPTESSRAALRRRNQSERRRQRGA